MHLYSIILSLFLFISLVGDADFTIETRNETDEPKALVIKRTSDFEITGDGGAENWNHTEWVIISQRDLTKIPLTTKTKILYSETGIYFLFHSTSYKTPNLDQLADGGMRFNYCLLPYGIDPLS